MHTANLRTLSQLEVKGTVEKSWDELIPSHRTIVPMAILLISEVARQMGLRPSAIRYYEEIGILPSPERRSGRRCYDPTVLHRLAIVQRARQTGFSLREIRQLFFGFSDVIPASGRWRQLSQRKLQELDIQISKTKAMRRLLIKMIERCSCTTLDQCGRGIFRGGYRQEKQKCPKTPPTPSRR